MEGDRRPSLRAYDAAQKKKFRRESKGKETQEGKKVGSTSGFKKKRNWGEKDERHHPSRSTLDKRLALEIGKKRDDTRWGKRKGKKVRE